MNFSMHVAAWHYKIPCRNILLSIDIQTTLTDKGSHYIQKAKAKEVANSKHLK